jgi:hypothetical protein
MDPRNEGETRTFITLRLLSELGEVDRIFTRLGHLIRVLSEGMSDA